MKKVILFFALAIAGVSGAYAQKQTGGEKNLEVQFTPLGGSPIGIDGIRLRIFTSETAAFRLRIGLTGSNHKTARLQPSEVPGNDPSTTVNIDALYDIDRMRNFSIRPGYEIHFAGTDRLSPYAGAEIFFAMGSESLEREFHNANNADDNDDYKPENWVTWTMSKKTKTTTIGFNVIAGVDYYFADNIYLGAELGLGFQNTGYKDIEVEISDENAYIYSDGSQFGGGDAQNDDVFMSLAHLDTDDNGTQKATINTLVGDGTSGADIKNFAWGTNFQSSIRLGWIFN